MDRSLEPSSGKQERATSIQSAQPGNRPGFSGSQSPKAIFSHQQFSATLPKGGGAIRGLEEKVEVDAARGTARLAIPLPAQAIRGGLSPELSLAYHSGDGNGPFGAGWSVGVPAISRRTDFGVPQYRDDEDSDRFVASGHDELVRVLGDDGFAIERLYPLEGGHDPLPTRPAKAPHYAVRPYRPRTESAFSVIEWWRKLTPRADGGWDCRESFWRIISKTNITSLYGFSAPARVSAPDDAAQIFQWSLERAFDDRGNAVLYEYAADPGEEAGLPFVSPCYLVGVKYGPSTPYPRTSWLQAKFPSTSAPWLFSVRLDYGAAIGQPADTLGQLVAQCEDPANRNRCIAPSQGPLRPDAFTTCRSGFAIRTRRLCRRILSLHHLADGYQGLARSLELTYQEDVYLTKLIAITQVMWDGATGRAFPPLQLSYADVPDLQRARVENLELPALPAIRPVFDQPRFSWVDLDAEGAPGALFQAADGNWLYCRNRGGGKLAGPEPVNWQAARTVLPRSVDAPRLLDLNADGLLDWVELQRPQAGRRERRSDYMWGEFAPFAHSPVLEMDDPNVRMFDFDGDGLVDLVRSEPGSYFWQRSLGNEGFAVPERLPWALDEKQGPRLLFSDRNAAVYLADLSGDGLTDLIRLRNGELSYWPNLGRGKFGARRRFTIRDENGQDTGEAPVFDRSERFEQRRIRLLDIDGTGLVDLAYLGVDGVRVWRNQAGNGFSRPITVPFPPVDDPDSVAVVDLFANGTSCLVYTPPTPGFAASALYLHLVGGQSPAPGTSPATDGAQKPHLLTRYTNHLGGETLFQYTSSAQFCVEDRERGHPWITKLGFPVHVIARTEKRDLVAGKTLVNSYRYRHGHFDGQEREFAGFAFVEQADSVRYDDFAAIAQAAHGTAASNIERAFHVPPVITRTWYHTGAGPRADTLSRRLRGEYFSADPDAILLPDTQFQGDLIGPEARGAVRALKGAVLRQEIYSGDSVRAARGAGASYAAGHPHSVSERSYHARRIQQTGSNRFASYFTHPAQQIDYHYEQQADDPRVQHQFTLEVDIWGNVVRSAKVAYGRRPAGLARAAAFLTETELHCQARRFVEYTERIFTNAVDNALDHHAPLPASEKTWELHACHPSRPDGWFRPADFATTPPEISYRTDPATIAQPCRRVIEHVEQSYWDPPAKGALPIGQMAIPALPHRSWKLAFTAEMRQDLADDAKRQVPAFPLTDPMLVGAGYEKRGDSWWAKSPYQIFDAPFFLPTASIDSFGALSTQSFDTYRLFPQVITDPEQDTTKIEYDYRLLQPRTITDANAAPTRILFDTRGFVAAMALLGNSSSPTGDKINQPSGDITPAAIAAFAAGPIAAAGNLLGTASSRYVYDLFAAMPADLPAWQPRSMLVRPAARVNPVWAATLARQFHVSQEPSFGKRIEMAIAYSDGFGEVAQTHQLTDPGPLDPLDAQSPAADPRWIRSGRRLVNNKGSAVREYDPKFSATHRFVADLMADEASVPTVFYDAPQRVVARLIPHRNYRQPDAPPRGVAGYSYEKHLFNAWDEAIWDTNDTVAIEPTNDPDVSAFFDPLPRSETGPTWLQVRTSPALRESHWPGDLQRQQDEADAAAKTCDHAETPARTFLDSLGNPFLSIIHHRRESAAIDEYFHTRTEYDIEGNRRAVYDARDREVAGWDYHLLGLPTRSRSMDAGVRVLLHAVDGQVVAEWNARGHHLATGYDKLRRVTELKVNGHVEESYAYGSTGSGQGVPAAYQRGQLIKQDDQAGTLAISRYDVHGRPTVIARGGKVKSDDYDAQSRLALSECGGERIKRTYSLSGQLASVTTDPGGAVVTSIVYNASGQRVRLRYGGKGGEVLTTFDPSSGRLHYQHTRDGKAQDLHQVYDPIGNIIHTRDRSASTVYFANQAVEPHQCFRYDSLYRLIRATGREHRGQTAPPPSDWERSNFARPVPHPADAQAMRRYVQSYRYDEVGNPTIFKHCADGNNWKRAFAYDSASNRLQSVTTTATGDIVDAFHHDAHGNMTSMGGYFRNMQWDHRDRMLSLENATGATLARFRYDAAGQRVEKTEGGDATFYFGEFEFYSHRRDSLIVRDGHGILATVDYGNGANPQVRLQLSNHLGSCTTEISTADGSVISHEEFHPYGTTSYHARKSGYEAKRYRYTAKERDDSTGLSYHGARYYAPWLTRWISADPSGVDSGVNVYLYCRCNPCAFSDPNGRLEFSGHFMLTYMTARAAGLDKKQADYLAFWAQAPDRIKQTDAYFQWRTTLGISIKQGISDPFNDAINGVKNIPVDIFNSFSDFVSGASGYHLGHASRHVTPLAPELAWRNLTYDRFHALTGGSAKDELQRSEKMVRDLEIGDPRLGLAIHRFQDSIGPHVKDAEKGTMHGPPLGHGVRSVFSRITFGIVSDPDKLGSNPAGDRDMMIQLYGILVKKSGRKGVAMSEDEFKSKIDAMIAIARDSTDPFDLMSLDEFTEKFGGDYIPDRGSINKLMSPNH
jgi:RHS repeat-associated protein